MAIMLIILASFKTLRYMLFKAFPNISLREVRWGISQVLMGIAFFVFGIAFTVLTLALSEIGGCITMGLAIALFVVAIAMIIYVFWLMIHYLRSSLSKSDGDEDE